MGFLSIVSLTNCAPSCTCCGAGGFVGERAREQAAKPREKPSTHSPHGISRNSPSRARSPTKPPATQAALVEVMQRSVPSWVAFWLVFTSVSVLNNALFVLLRPHTLPGGKWNYIFKLRKLECEHPQLSDHTSSELYSCVKLVPSIFDIFVFQTTLISKLIQDTMILKTDLRLEKTGKFYVNSEALQNDLSLLTLRRTSTRGGRGVDGNTGCLPFAKKIRKFRLGCKWKGYFGLPDRKVSERNVFRCSSKFPTGISERKMCVPFRSIFFFH